MSFITLCETTLTGESVDISNPKSKANVPDISNQAPPDLRPSYLASRPLGQNFQYCHGLFRDLYEDLSN